MSNSKVPEQCASAAQLLYRLVLVFWYQDLVPNVVVERLGCWLLQGK